MLRTRAAAFCVFGLLAIGCGASHHESRAAPPPSRGATQSSPRGAAAPQQAASADNWPTYGRTAARSGFNRHGVALGHLRRRWSAALDGAVYAQPLVADGKAVAATENDSVYAFDARTGRQLWRAHLGSPVPQSDLPCGNIDPSGITSTPVIDVSGRTVYAVAFETPAHHTLTAIDLASGNVKWRRSIDPPGADPRVHQQRGALTLSRGRVYVPYGGLFGDCGDYHGWVVGVPASGPSGRLAGFRVPTHREGGIWAPPGASVDRAGKLYVATGNGDSSSFDFGNSVIRLSPDLRREAYFAPRGAGALNVSDTDLGSTGPLLLPSHRAFSIGKSGTGYLLSTSRLGGIGGQLFSAHVCSSAFGASSYARGYIYVPCDDGVHALRLRGRRFQRAWRGPGFNAGPPIVAGRTAWVVDIDGGVLSALDSRSGHVKLRLSIGNVAHFASPAVAGGRVYVAAQRHLTAFGAR